jgi:hypothetical protein
MFCSTQKDEIDHVVVPETLSGAVAGSLPQSGTNSGKPRPAALCCRTGP